ncbi:MAG: hypothetical protein HZB59_03835 [Ignavibacteriales bacterium]|nr:hypothetical protein [Ignavibacteriales bacterium]
MELSSQSDIKRIFRVTGTPENFLTALRYKVWGFNNKLDWEKQEPGDIIFFHSQGKSVFKSHPMSCIVGFGVVGNNFFTDNTPLWIDEKIDDKSYPFKFSFSEIYLFSDIPINDDWDSTTLKKKDITLKIIEKLIENGIPLADLQRFPHMGSYSSIKNADTISQLLKANREYSFYFGENEENIITKSTSLTEFADENESLRYATSLSVFDDIKRKVIRGGSSSKKMNFDLLSRAEQAHFDIVSYLRLFFRNKGYKVFNNNHVDIFAHDSKTSVLIEAKSVENKNFKSQSRKGIIQLYEYSYFEIAKYKTKNNLKFNNDFKVLATSKKPDDSEYIKFINSLGIQTTAVINSQIISYGHSIDLHNL